MKYEIEGYNLDDLIRKVYKKKIKIFDVEKCGEKKLKFSADDKDHVRVKKFIKNFQHIETGSLKKCFKNALISSIGVSVGVVIGLAFFLISKNYIWNIKIIGNVNLETKEILQVLGEKGVKVGGTNSFDTEYVEDVLLNKYNMIAQASVIKRGTSIIINISEKLVYNDTKYNPIVASYPGIIRKINLVTGTLNVSVGDFVNVGDILVFPYNVDTFGNPISVIPEAKIEADIFVSSVESISRHSKMLVDTGNTCVAYVYKYRDFELFKGKRENSFDIFSVEVYNEYISDILPLSREVCVYHEQQFVDREVDFAEVCEVLIEKSKASAESNLPEGEIVDTKTYTEIINETLYAYTNITVYGEINANNQRTN